MSESNPSGPIAFLAALLFAAIYLSLPAQSWPAGAASASSWAVMTTLSGSTPSIAVSGDGLAHVAYFGPEGPTGSQVLHAGEGAWRPEVVDGPETRGASTAIALAADTPHIAYDYPRFGIRYATPERDGTWTRIKVEASNPNGTEVSLSVGPDGQPYIGFHATRGNDFRHGMWEPARDNFFLRTSSLGDIGRFNNVAVGGDGAFQLSYYDSSNRAVYYERGLPERYNENALTGVNVTSRIALALEDDDTPQLAVVTAGGAVWARREQAGWQTEPIPGTAGVRHLDLKLDIEGTSHIVWSGATGDLHHAMRIDGEWSSSTIPAMRGGRLSLAIYGERLMLAVESVNQTEINVLEGLAGPPPTAIPPTPTRTPEATPTAGPSPTLAPASLDLWLSAGCDREYRRGTILFARFSATRSGRLILDYSPPGQRPLYDGPVVAGHPWAAALAVAGDSGRRNLIATMPEHGLEARCRYDVAP